MPRGRRYFDPFVQDADGVIRNPHTGEVVGHATVEVAENEDGTFVEEFVEEVVGEAIPGPRAFRLQQPGVYLLLDDIVASLNALAAMHDEAGNPSASLALREVAEAWTED